MPQMEPYDGLFDPPDHLKSYKALMALQRATNTLLCRAFPATFYKAARLWFSGLKPYSILSFEQLERQLTTYFAANRGQHGTSDSLFAIEQREGEPLKDYIDCFTSATWKIRNLDQSIVISALKTGARSYKFLFSIEKSFSVNFIEILAQARKYAKTEEAMAFRREAAEQPAKMKKKRLEECSRPRSRSPRHEKNPLRPQSPADPRSPAQMFSKYAPLPKFGRYTPLSSTRAEILMGIEGRGYLQPPSKMRSSAPRKCSDKYRRFHKDYGHDTKDYYQLRNEIEVLIRHGRLNQFVTGQPKRRVPEEQNREPPKEQNNSRPIVGIIHTIGGGRPECLRRRAKRKEPLQNVRALWRLSPSPMRI
ncbi:uncharacterized protein LOC120105559 [Phoenix dactylifera]|uniref:Uncharacterized protein LOC120105559 n=1 Tax=Phoenix dactylifera TaxID=42345 RepID=A0A8B8ZIQ9_PHODC|nr:uncharacterized protein LOC120105559 [Phoenix dactylifera]